jgi:CheY-like chemotaxis protein
MIRKCYYKGCGVVYGQKEPLSDRRVTHGLCPKHYELSLEEIKSEMEALKLKSGGFKILIVEDSTLFRQAMKEVLRDRFPGVEIHEAGDGKEAMKKVEAFLPDIIFMDIRLPQESGLDLTKKIKVRHPKITVIVLTAYDLPEYREASEKYADYFFSKGSVKTENILALVKTILSTGR